MFEGLFQPMHLLVIFGIALLVLGPRKLPELGKGLGEAIRGFKNSFNGNEATPPEPAARGEDAFGSRSPAEPSDFPRRATSRSETI
jgi:sec-independent protein translocase protein TatA